MDITARIPLLYFEIYVLMIIFQICIYLTHDIHPQFVVIVFVVVVVIIQSFLYAQRRGQQMSTLDSRQTLITTNWKYTATFIRNEANKWQFHKYSQSHKINEWISRHFVRFGFSGFCFYIFKYTSFSLVLYHTHSQSVLWTRLCSVEVNASFFPTPSNRIEETLDGI